MTTEAIRRVLALTITAAGTALLIAGASAAPLRTQRPCDIYEAAGTPCVAAHSTTRALYAAYKGPLYQLKRESDGRTLDIGVTTPGGYANSAAQDTFCLKTICVINRIYDQSPKGNHLYQAPPGPLFPGPAKGGFDTQPIADMAPITIDGHKAYGVYIMPGMGFRNNDASGIAIGDEPEGIYYVIDGTHYDSGCCFDYGNSSTNGRAVGTGTMETTYFGTSTVWGRGNGSGPWIMSDMEAGLFSGYDAKQNIADPAIDSWRFVTAVVDGGGGNRWDLRGGNSQKGGLTTFYSGVRPGSKSNPAYYPMHKQGGILLGTGGDNGNGSSGTFYEGVMTSGYPSEATTDAVQANIVAARYDVQRLNLSRLTSFTAGSTQEIIETFTNTTRAEVKGLKLSIAAAPGWTAIASANTAVTFSAGIPSGATVTATFRVTSPQTPSAGFLIGRADWARQSDTSSQRVRSAPAIRINEVRLSNGANPTDQFIELYNASRDTADLSNWTLTNAQTQSAPVKLATIPAGTKLARGAFYLLGLSTSGLAAPSSPGATRIYVRSVEGFAPGQQIDIDGETRRIVDVGTPASPGTTIFEQVSTKPWITVPAGSTNFPVTSTSGFAVGQKMAIDVGGNSEVAMVNAVGKAATQTTLSAPVSAGITNIKLATDSNITAGDTLTIGTGSGKEILKVNRVDANGVSLATPLRRDHAAGIDVSDPGTGVTFSPATKFPHVSGDAIQALGSGITLDRPLTNAHQYGAPAINQAVATAGYQGSPAPAQWFGAALSTRSGSIALTDTSGSVLVDAIVYGSRQSNSSANGTIPSPEIAILEGDQGSGGCIAVAPSVVPVSLNRSLGRFPDGADTDSNCRDFLTQPATVLGVAAPEGANNIKVPSVADFVPGQGITIDAGANSESAVIASVGTSGGTLMTAASEAGASVLRVASSAGLATGQTIAVDTGANAETAVITSTTGGRAGATITVASPLTHSHTPNAQVSGSGITLAGGLTHPHATGAQVISGSPTPGAPNQYTRPRN